MRHSHSHCYSNQILADSTPISLRSWIYVLLKRCFHVIFADFNSCWPFKAIIRIPCWFLLGWITFPLDHRIIGLALMVRCHNRTVFFTHDTSIMVPLVKKNTWTFLRCVWGVIPKALFFFRLGIMKHHTLCAPPKPCDRCFGNRSLSRAPWLRWDVSLQWSTVANMWIPYYMYIYIWSNVPPGDCYCEGGAGGASQWILTFSRYK